MLCLLGKANCQESATPPATNWGSVNDFWKFWISKPNAHGTTKAPKVNVAQSYVQKTRLHRLSRGPMKSSESADVITDHGRRSLLHLQRQSDAFQHPEVPRKMMKGLPARVRLMGDKMSDGADPLSLA